MTITFAELIAAALIKFSGKIDTLDISILISMINEPYTFSNKSDNRLTAITEFQNNNYQLQFGYTLDTEISPNLTIKEYLATIAEANALNFMNELDLTYLVLRKINQLGGICEANLNSRFNKLEVNTILNLINEGYLYTLWTKEATYDDYPSVVISKKGEVYLFFNTYQTQIKMFENELIAKGYNPNLLGPYLITKNLHRPFNEIFDISSFEYFGHIYDLDLTKPEELSR